MKKGDAIARFAQPIARGIDAIVGTSVSECVGCKSMRENLNSGMSVTDAIYERWFKAKQQGEKMKYQITVIVDGEKPSEASAKAEAIGEVLSVQARPPQQPK
jgi:hypothetical protein